MTLQQAKDLIGKKYFPNYPFDDHWNELLNKTQYQLVLQRKYHDDAAELYAKSKCKIAWEDGYETARQFCGLPSEKPANPYENAEIVK